MKEILNPLIDSLIVIGFVEFFIITLFSTFTQDFAQDEEEYTKDYFKKIFLLPQIFVLNKMRNYTFSGKFIVVLFATFMFFPYNLVPGFIIIMALGAYKIVLFLKNGFNLLFKKKE